MSGFKNVGLDFFFLAGTDIYASFTMKSRHRSYGPSINNHYLLCLTFLFTLDSISFFYSGLEV
jgi:hypothetical protein